MLPLGRRRHFGVEQQELGVSSEEGGGGGWVGGVPAVTLAHPP